MQFIIFNLPSHVLPSLANLNPALQSQASALSFFIKQIWQSLLLQGLLAGAKYGKDSVCLILGKCYFPVLSSM